MFRRLVKWYQRGQELKVAQWQLENMTDTQLSDIGITRGEIYQKVYS